jgi:hypothetical protein
MKFGSRSLGGNLGEIHPLIKYFYSISGLANFNTQEGYTIR